MILPRGLPRPSGVFPEDPPRFAGTVRRCRLHGAYMAAAGGVFAPAPCLDRRGICYHRNKGSAGRRHGCACRQPWGTKESRGSAALCGGCG